MPWAAAGSGGLASLLDPDAFYTNQSINGFVTRLVDGTDKSVPLWSGGFDPRTVMMGLTAAFALATLAPFVQSHYADQVSLYALATVRLLGVASRKDYDARFGGILYCFLRGLDESGAGLWTTRPTWDQTTAWERELRQRMERRA